jgi:hypothetical protein
LKAAAAHQLNIGFLPMPLRESRDGEASTWVARSDQFIWQQILIL